MPRPKKGSPEAKAWGEQMKAKRLAKQTDNPIEGPEESDVRQNDDVEQLKAQIAELQKLAFFNQPAPAPMAPSTKVVVTKYSFDPKIYPDPRPRIAQEPKLAPFAFDYHYEMTWQVKKVDSEEDGIKIRQPRFEIELWQKVLDDDNKPTKRFRRKKWMFFEDPDSYIAIANQQGIEVPEHLEKPFLDEMRYLNFRDAVFEVFFPPKVTSVNTLTEEVIGNQLVSVQTITSDVGGPTPTIEWDKMNSRM